jgi:hypothetical protein
MFLGLSDPYPDPLVRGTDPRIRIRTKMSRIPNTAFMGHFQRLILFCNPYVLLLFYYSLRLSVVGGRVQRVAQHQEAVAERLQECGGGDLCGPRRQDHQVRPRQHLVESQGTSILHLS